MLYIINCFTAFTVILNTKSNKNLTNKIVCNLLMKKIIYLLFLLQLISAKPNNLDLANQILDN